MGEAKKRGKAIAEADQHRARVRRLFQILDSDPITVLAETASERQGTAKRTGEPVTDTTALAGLHKARLTVRAKAYGITGEQARLSRVFLRQHGYEIPSRP